MANYNDRPTIGERIKEAIPGTDEYRATHGVTGAHSNVQGMKSNIPGTEEHRMREAGVVGGGTGLAGTGVGHHTGTGMGHTGVGQPTMGERIKESIPGTREYEATHGMTQGHQTAQQVKSHIPGTEEHRIRTDMQPGYGTGMAAPMGATGTGVGHHGTGMGTTGMGTTGMGTHTGTGMGTTGVAGTGVNERGEETMGHKIKKMIPGSEEHKEKKMMEGRI